MVQSEEQLTDSPPQRGRFAIFERATAWLFSQQHFHLKLLSGTAPPRHARGVDVDLTLVCHAVAYLAKGRSI
ncbi:MAG: hypothetical protein ABJB69_00520 [Spartobacteria bacterium]